MGRDPTIRYDVTEEYPSGHEMNRNVIQTGTEAELRAGALVTALNGLSDEVWPTWQRLEELFESGSVACEDGYTYILVPIKDWCIVVRWSEPEDGVCVHGPYASSTEASAAIMSVKPQYVNPFSSPGEAARADGEYMSADECGDMGFAWGGVIPDDVEFDVAQMNTPVQS